MTALTVGDVLNFARDLHPAHDRSRTPDRVAIRLLSTIERDLAAEVAQVNPDYLLSTATISSPISAGESSPQTIPAFHHVRGGTVKFDDDELNNRGLELVTWERRYRVLPNYQAYLRGGSLYFTGIDEDWDAVTSVDVYYTPIPPVLSETATALTASMTLTDQARGVCQWMLAQHMAVRAAAHPDTPAASRPDVEYFIGMADRAHTDYRLMVAQQRRQRTWMVGGA